MLFDINYLATGVCISTPLITPARSKLHLSSIFPSLANLTHSPYHGTTANPEHKIHKILQSWSPIFPHTFLTPLHCLSSLLLAFSHAPQPRYPNVDSIMPSLKPCDSLYPTMMMTSPQWRMSQWVLVGVPPNILSNFVPYSFWLHSNLYSISFTRLDTC